MVDTILAEKAIGILTASGPEIGDDQPIFSVFSFLPVGMAEQNEQNIIDLLIAKKLIYSKNEFMNPYSSLFEGQKGLFQDKSEIQIFYPEIIETFVSNYLREHIAEIEAYNQDPSSLNSKNKLIPISDELKSLINGYTKIDDSDLDPAYNFRQNTNTPDESKLEINLSMSLYVGMRESLKSKLFSCYNMVSFEKSKLFELIQFINNPKYESFRFTPNNIS